MATEQTEHYSTGETCIVHESCDGTERTCRTERGTRPEGEMSTHHTHRPLTGTQYGYGAGTVSPRCRRPDCPVSGAHISVRCRCGATGTICPQQRRTTWQVRQ